MESANDDYSQLPQDKAELMRRISFEWQALQQSFSGLSEAQMSIPDAGGWSIKDNLAHIMVWERYLHLHYLGRQPAHEVMGVGTADLEKMDQDQLNAVIYARNKDRPLTAILAEVNSTHTQVIADLDKMGFDEMMVVRKEENPEKNLLLDEIIWNTYAHFREHRLTIEKNPGRKQA